MKISLGSWAFSFGPYVDDPVPLETIIKRLSEAGYDGIEICGFPPHLSLDCYPTLESRRQLAALLQDHHLGVSGYAADFSSINPVVQGNRERYLDLFRRNVQMCVDIGSPAIRVDTVAAPGSVRNRDYQATFDRLADLWREAAGIAQDAGIRMVWEFEPGFLFNKPSEILSMHQLVAHPNFRILFDTTHAYMCSVVGARQHGAREVLQGGVAELLSRLQGRIGAVHLIDSDGTLHGDETSRHCPFGTGVINFRALAPALRAIPGIDWWCIDLCFWEGAWELVDPSRQYVLNLIRSSAGAH
ncbi:MAG TPA: sugar phosphate isomerase/epimerase family protein [Bryobacteraceae bacterium]|nr:sugar phosphate isomerase/epimerase family protein [Bryobacteraceae bacterium]